MVITSLSLSAQTTFKLKDLISQQEEMASANEPSAELQAILPELSIIRQQYRLERNNEFFGKNNEPYYGENYSLSIKVSGGTIISSTVIEPWIYDSDYARDNASGTYTPVLYWTYQRPITEATYSPINLEINGTSDYVYPLNADKSLYLHTDAISDFGLSIDSGTGVKNGYVIWAYSKAEVPDSAMAINCRQSSFTIDAKADSSLIKMNPTNHEKIIGGIFVTPKFERGGRVQYLLSGVAVRNKSDEWYLQLLCTDDRITKSESSSIITKSKDENKGGSNKKKK